MHRFRRLGFITLSIVVLGIVAQGVAARLTDLSDSPDRPAAEDAAGQTAPTRTPGFGPILTAPPPPPTITPGGPTATPTLTRTVTITPPPTLGRTPTESPTPEITGTPLPTLDADRLGIQIDPAVSLEEYDTMLWLVGRLGVKWIKFQFAWDLLEPQQGAFSDVVLQIPADGAARGSGRAERDDQHRQSAGLGTRQHWKKTVRPRSPQDLANFIPRLMGEVRVDLYGNSYFEAIEVWNEPNLRREWNGGTLSGAEYMRYFDAAYNAIRSGEGGHSVTIITAGLAPTGINDGQTAVDDRAYLRQMYAAGSEQRGLPEYRHRDASLRRAQPAGRALVRAE